MRFWCISALAALVGATSLAKPQHFSRSSSPSESLTSMSFSKTQSLLNTQKQSHTSHEASQSSTKQTKEYKMTMNRSLGKVLASVSPAKQATGYIDSGKNNMFFWLSESRNDPSKDPLVLWLGAGPGLSAIQSMFLENGPYNLNPDGKVVENPHSWTNGANIIYLDQPGGTGFSSGSPSTNNSIDAAEDIYSFIQLFYKEFPQFKDRPVYLAGESYAGHYLATLGAYIMTDPQRPVNVGGIMIGSSIMDPLTQFQFVHPRACKPGSELLSHEACNTMQQNLPQCLEFIQECYSNSTSEACAKGSLFCQQTQFKPLRDANINVYDVSQPCEDTKSDLCYKEADRIADFLSQPEIKNAIGVHPSAEFRPTNSEVVFDFLKSGDWLQPYHMFLGSLLDLGVPVLIYTGENDLLANWQGAESWTQGLVWRGAQKYKNAPLEYFRTPAGGSGQVRRHSLLQNLQIFNAGNMPPHNQPETMKELFLNWLTETKDLTKSIHGPLDGISKGPAHNQEVQMLAVNPGTVTVVQTNFVTVAAQPVQVSSVVTSIQTKTVYTCEPPPRTVTSFPTDCPTVATVYMSRTITREVPVTRTFVSTRFVPTTVTITDCSNLHNPNELLGPSVPSLITSTITRINQPTRPPPVLTTIYTPPPSPVKPVTTVYVSPTPVPLTSTIYHTPPAPVITSTIFKRPPAPLITSTIYERPIPVTSTIYERPPQPPVTSTIYERPPQPPVTSTIYERPPQPLVTSTVYVPPQPLVTSTVYVPPPPSPVLITRTPEPAPPPVVVTKTMAPPPPPPPPPQQFVTYTVKMPQRPTPSLVTRTKHSLMTVAVPSVVTYTVEALAKPSLVTLTVPQNPGEPVKHDVTDGPCKSSCCISPGPLRRFGERFFGFGRGL